MASSGVAPTQDHDRRTGPPASIAGVRRRGPARALAGAAPIAVVLVLAAVSAAAPRAARSGDTVVTVEPLVAGTSIWMRSAPHVGRRTCELEGGTRARFIAQAMHGGRHRYAEIEPLEGACAGQHGYVPWSSIEPKPATDPGGGYN